MNLRILLQIKSVCGVVGRDSMLVFDEECNRSDLWRKVHEKWEKIHILGNFRWHVPVQPEHVPVHFGFWSFWANMYRYMLGLYGYM